MNTFKRPEPIDTQSIVPIQKTKKNVILTPKLPIFQITRPKYVNKESLSVAGEANERNRSGSGDKIISGKVLFGTEKKPSILKNVYQKNKINLSSL